MYRRIVSLQAVLDQRAVVERVCKENPTGKNHVTPIDELRKAITKCESSISGGSNDPF